MNNTPLIFDGSVSTNYETYLTPFVFDPFSQDIVERIRTAGTKTILELACGTGSVTRVMQQKLPADIQITATDLQPDMLEIAKTSADFSNVSWALVDMTDMPYEDNSFDVIVCQFGVMLVPERRKALDEIFRVLKKGGQLLFSVWGNIEANGIWNIGGKVVESFMGINPIIRVPGPFAMKDEETINVLHEIGFVDALVHTVNKTGATSSAKSAAKGFLHGLPVFVLITQKDPSLIPKIELALEQQLIEQLGNDPLLSPLQAWVFEASK